MARNLFKESFKNILNEELRPLNEADLADEMQGELGAQEIDSTQAEFESQLADDVDSIDPNNYNREEQRLQAHLKKRAQENNELLSQWVSTIDDFTSFVNDPNRDDSIKNIIERAMPGSVLEKIKKSEARRLTRVSTECVGCRSYNLAVNGDAIQALVRRGLVSKRVGAAVDRLRREYVFAVVSIAFGVIGSSNSGYLSLIIVGKCGFTADAIDSLSKLLIGIVSVGYRLVSNRALCHVAVSVLCGCYGDSVCHRCAYLFGKKTPHLAKFRRIFSSAEKSV